jgi:hypothetical protein
MTSDSRVRIEESTEPYQIPAARTSLIWIERTLERTGRRPWILAPAFIPFRIAHGRWIDPWGGRIAERQWIDRGATASVDRSRGGLFVPIVSLFFRRAETVDLKRSIKRMGLNPFPAQQTSAPRNDAQKSIRGTLSPKRFGQSDRTAENVWKLHPTVQIVQIVRELLDGWVIMSLIWARLLLSASCHWVGTFDPYD